MSMKEAAMVIPVLSSDAASEIELAREAAYHCLLDALACAFQALQHSACTKLLGPLVPGATMTFGARVPGTSFQLDPVQAAFNLGTMIGWLDQRDAAFATCNGHLADTLGALLSVGDYQARKALAEARAPATVRDVLINLLEADGSHQRAGAEDWSASISAQRCDEVRAAGAVKVASMLGATAAQITRAIDLAASEARVSDTGGVRPRWWLGDANARGVRLALLAVNEAPVGAEPNADNRLIEATPLLVAPDFAGPWKKNFVAPALDAATTGRIRERFVASVTTHFPAVQAEKIRATFMDRVRLESLYINELVSLTVRN
jgi:2-methylcitrate dehydratase PrpD